MPEMSISRSGHRRNLLDVNPPRRFLVSDGMVLIAATAVALAIFRACRAELNPWRWWRTGFCCFPFATDTGFLWSCLILASPFAIAWTLAILGLRLRHPSRPRWRRLIRQPGLVAGLAAASVLAARQFSLAMMYARVTAVPSHVLARALFRLIA